MVSKRRFVVILMAVVLFNLFLVEIGLRFYLQFKNGIPFLHAEQSIYSYYWELRPVVDASIKKGDEYFDVLILSASTFDVDNEHGQKVIKGLTEKLEGALKQPVRLHNVSRNCMSSLDSKIKYSYLLDKDFDCIVWYNSVNDVRANNAPDNFFQKDYTHFIWYKKILTFDQCRGISRWTAIPYYLQLAWINVENKLHLKPYVPTYWGAADEWAKYGNKIKTEESMRDNLLYVLENAKKNNIPVMVLTTAFYIPNNYSQENLKNGLVDWNKNKSPVEGVGLPDNVRANLKVHNDVIKRTVQGFDYPEMYFVDFDNMLEKSKLYYDDMCHFTDKGIDQFVDALVRTIQKSTSQ